MKIEFVLIVDVDTIKIVQTVAVLRSGINVFYLSNCLHELGTAARRKNIWKSRLKFDIMNT